MIWRVFPYDNQNTLKYVKNCQFVVCIKCKLWFDEFFYWVIKILLFTGEDHDRQTPLNDENEDTNGDGKKSDSRSPSPAGNATAEPRSDPHDRTPSLSPEPEVTTKQNRAVRGDSKHSSRDYEQSRFFESNRPPARGIQSRLQSRLVIWRFFKK